MHNSYPLCTTMSLNVHVTTDDYGGNISDASMESEASAYITVLSPKNSSSPLQNSLRSRSASPRAQNTDESLYVQLPSVEMIKKLQARRKASCPSALVCSTPPQINLQLTDEVTLDSRKSANRLKVIVYVLACVL